MADYYKFIEILQEHHCKWLTTNDEYDTTTANGRPLGYYVNSDKRLEVVPEGTAIVQDAFNQYESTVSQRRIQKYTQCKFLSPAYQQ